MYSTSIRLPLAALFLLLLAGACRHYALVDPAGGGGGVYVPPASTCSPDSVYFVRDIMPLIASNCTMSGCHDNGSAADGVVLTSYNNIMRYVRPGNAAESKLYKVVVRTDGDRMPPPPMPPLTAAQKSLLQRWINQGAKNNNCTGACDTAVFTFSGAVRPLMEAKCVGCHSLSNPGGGVDLSTYQAVRTYALNGRLYGSIAHQAPYSPMPKNSAKLTDCEIRQVQKWIEAGTLNN